MNKTLIQTIDYKDWFINQKRIPDKESGEFKPFFAFHKQLCLDGFYMGGEFFNPFLYWHLNVWHTEVDVIDDRGRVNQKYANPYLRDNEWIITNEITRAENEHKGLAIGGIRRLAKSVIEASYISHGATFDENSQNVVSGLNAADIKLITDKIDKGLNAIPEAWRWQRVEDNWKSQVTLGVKTKNGERIPFSQILIRNLDEGNNEEAIAGTKPRKLIIDEGGKGSFLRGLQAAIPGFTTSFGVWGCSPIVTFTGGDMKRFMDAKSLMFDVKQFNFLEYKNEDDEKRIHGLFIGAKYRMETKEPSTLGTFLRKEEGNPLHNVEMLVSNEEKALELTRTNIATKRAAGDKKAYLKEKMYYPEKVDDIFLNETSNIYNTESAKAQQIRIRVNELTGIPVELFHDGEQIRHKFSNKQLITEFPVRTQSMDAPVILWEPPMFSPPYGLYVAGVDPYRQGQAIFSDSLGAVYIFKRMHDIQGEYQYMFVASYVARPDDKGDWEEQARLLIKYYNSRTLVENDDISFIEYMKAKGDARYLEPQPSWLKEISPTMRVKRDYGIHTSNPTIKNHLNTCYKTYLDEVVLQEFDEEGSVIKEHLGVNRILDPMLLEETINFNDVDNFDRQVAASLAICLAMHLDPIIGKISSIETDERVKAYFKKKSPDTQRLRQPKYNPFRRRSKFINPFK